MRRSLLAATLAGATIGCSHQAPLHQLTALGGKTVTVVMDGDAEHEGVVHLAAEGWFVRTPQGDIPFTKAKHLEVVRRGRGAVDGLGIGALVGALSGVIIGYSSGDDECGDEFCLLEFSAGEKAVFAAIGLGGLGAIAGALLGAAIGSRDVYDLEAAPRIVPSGPPGSVIGATVRF